MGFTSTCRLSNSMVTFGSEMEGGICQIGMDEKFKMINCGKLALSVIKRAIYCLVDTLFPQTTKRINVNSATNRYWLTSQLPKHSCM